MNSLYHKREYDTRTCPPPEPIIYLSKIDLLPLHHPTFTVYKQDIIWRLRGQLTELPTFDYLLDKFHSETDGHDARADDLTRRRYDKRPKKRNRSKGRRAGIADVRPSGSAGDSATARLWIFLFRLVAVRACACLGERSEPTCIRQAHAMVPTVHFYLAYTPNV